MSLARLARGQSAVIARIDVSAADAALLRAMGLVEGERVHMLRAAPFGGPCQVRVGTAAFALDRALAGLVSVSPVEDEVA